MSLSSSSVNRGRGGGVVGIRTHIFDTKHILDFHTALLVEGAKIKPLCSICLLNLPLWPWPSPPCSSGLIQKNSDPGILFIAWAAESHKFLEPKKTRHHWSRIYRIPRDGRMRLRMESQSQPCPTAFFSSVALVTTSTHIGPAFMDAPRPQPAAVPVFHSLPTKTHLSGASGTTQQSHMPLQRLTPLTP